ncbi:MAG: AIPR family protein [Pseudomonadota bacterium]
MSDIVLLDKVLEAKKDEYPASYDDGEVFEYFVVDTLLRNYGLSYDQLEDGIVDGANDGGIDALYVFVNRTLVTDDFDYSLYKGDIKIECHVFQAKRKDSFEEAVVNSLHTSLPKFFDNEVSSRELKKTLNNSVVSKRELFSECLSKFATKFPSASINIHYACRGVSPSEEMKQKASDLGKLVGQKLSIAQTFFEFYSAKDLYKHAKQQATVTLSIPVYGSPLNVDNGFVALVGLEDYFDFIADGGQLLERLFEFNIRDYEGGVSVNKDMKETLADKTGEIDFWWLNNGVTIIAEEAKNLNNSLVVTNPLIVNGLQTSNEIFNANPKEDDRKLLVRVIDTEDEKVRDKIIKATNSQTKIKESSLRATDELQRKIEDYLVGESIFYDRRKNYYKNKGKPAKQIIGIDRLAQCAYSVVARRPDVARGRPGNIIRDDDLYTKVFSSGHPLGIYATCFRLHYVVAQHFHSVRKTVDSLYRNNLRFHTMMVLSWELCGDKDIPHKKLADLDLSLASTDVVESVFNWLCELFDEFGAEDKVAKDLPFVNEIISKWTKLT